MNLGLPDNALKNIKLQNIEESDTYLTCNGLNMYRLAAGYLQPNTGNLLEIGCGYGAGAYYFKKYAKATSVHGIDANCMATAFASKQYQKQQGLSYHCMKAEDALQLKKRFSAVVSIEAAMHFKSHSNFIEIACGLLENAGLFVFADILSAEQKESVKAILKNSGFHTEHCLNLSDYVIESILSTTSSGGLLKYLERVILDANNANFTRNSSLFKKLQNRETEYLMFVCRKS